MNSFRPLSRSVGLAFPVLVVRPCLLLLLLLLAALSTADAADWPHYRGPHANGTTTEAVTPASWPAEGPRRVWKASVGTGFSSISITDGRVCSMGNTDGTDHVVCLDEQTGDELWRHSYPCPLDDNLFEGGPTSTPTIEGDSIYTFSRRGQLFCLDATSGDVRWSVNVRDDADSPMPTWGFGSSVLVEGELVLLNAGGAGIALNKTTGEIVWSSGEHEAAYASPVNFSPDVVLFLSGRELTGVNVRSGEPVWSYRWLTRYGVNATDPTVAGDRVFLSSGYGKGAALLDVGGGMPEEVWRSRDLKTQFSTAILHDGYLYGIDGDTTDVARLRCLEFETGDVQWTHDGVGSGSILLAADQLLVLTDEGDLLVAPVSPDQFTPVATAHVLDGKCWTSPALANGRLYCRNADGDLVCLEIR